MTLDDRYLTDLILDGDVAGLEEAAAVLDDFPDGRDALTGTRWIVHALSVGPVESVRWMLARGVDLAFEPDDGYTPLLAALERERPDRYEVLALLIEHGAPLDARGINDWTPLHMAAAREDLQALEMLLAAGADPEIRTRIDDCATPREEARILGRERAVACLEAHARARALGAADGEVERG